MALTTDQLKKYWDTAYLLRKNLDAAEYKHIVLGLVFLKYVSDSFEERRAELILQFSDPQSETFKKDDIRRADALNERDYYKAVNVFWVPETSRWLSILENAKQPDIAQRIDNALYEIEKENPKLEGMIERRYAEGQLGAEQLGQVVDLIASISFKNENHNAADILGNVYEYFLANFASEEGKLGGQFYTTPSIVKTIVEILKPTHGRVYDPCCGSGGMFVQSEKFIEAHGGRINSISVYGQESNPTTRKLCAMNLAIRGIDFNLGETNADTFLNDQHKDTKFDFILMNPPFGIRESYPRELLLSDVRWKKYGVPRKKPANYAWISHAIHHLAPQGRAGIVNARSTLLSRQGGDDVLRKGFIEDDIVECIVDLPAKLFFKTQTTSCIWFINKGKQKLGNQREGEVLFIDARHMGHAISSTQIEFSEDEIQLIGKTYENWASGDYHDVEGFCASVNINEIAARGYALAPSRYVGTEESEEITRDEAVSAAQEIALLLRSNKERISALTEKCKASIKCLGLNENFSKGLIDENYGSNQPLIAFTDQLYRSWFIEFQPMKIGKSTDGSVPFDKYAPLFPNAFIDSDIGPIPESWEVKSVGDIVNRVKIRPIQKDFNSDDLGQTIIFEQGNQLVAGYSEDEGQISASEESPYFIFGDHTCRMRLSTVPFSILPNIIVLKGANRDTYWTFNATNSIQDFESYRRHWMEFESKKVCLPPKELCDAFGELVAPFYSLYDAREYQLRLEASYREFASSIIFDNDELDSGEISI